MKINLIKWAKIRAHSIAFFEPGPTKWNNNTPTIDLNLDKIEFQDH